ncbi:MAG TPA: efflux RND transporter periplasmic adaptor subunit [Bryobacteraceae bacterium]|nr:efflux RND transporter periplasmic adaptor subunit [Bryobacteraceae bacterium]
MRTIFLPAIFSVLILGGCEKQQAPAAGAAAAGAPPEMSVSVAKASSESVPTEVHVVGTVEASAVVQVKSQIAGQLDSVSFTEGQNVKQGEVLFHIDPRPYEDALQQAEAAVERDKAQVAQAEANVMRDQAQAKFAETDATRQEQLNKENLASKMAADQARTTLDVNRATARASEATVNTARATLASDTSALSKARLDLSYCTIAAPISGRTGNLLVHPGNLVKENDVALVVIHQVEPIFVSFGVPENYLAAIRRLNAVHALPVRATLQDSGPQAATGSLSVIDNTVDATTGTIHLKATFDNHDAMLWPGQFVNVALTLDTVRDATVVPTVAVQSGQQGQVVFVVNAHNIVEIRPVITGVASGSQTVIEKGISPGETVVTDGQMALFPGAPVRIVDPSKGAQGPQ